MKRKISRKESKLYLLNDNSHSFFEVIEVLIKDAGHNPYQAENCAMITHFTGKCLIKTSKEKHIIQKISQSLNKQGFNTQFE